MIGLVILLAAIVGISAFVAILLVDNANTAAKIKELEDCKVWVKSLNKCASEELTQWYLNHNSKEVNAQ